MQEAVKGQFWRLRDSQGKPPGVIGWWPSRAVTFIDNHDTGSTQVPELFLYHFNCEPRFCGRILSGCFCISFNDLKLCFSWQLYGFSFLII